MKRGRLILISGWGGGGGISWILFGQCSQAEAGLGPGKRGVQRRDSSFVDCHGLTGTCLGPPMSHHQPGQRPHRPSSASAGMCRPSGLAASYIAPLLWTSPSWTAPSEQTVTLKPQLLASIQHDLGRAVWLSLWRFFKPFGTALIPLVSVFVPSLSLLPRAEHEKGHTTSASDDDHDHDDHSIRLFSINSHSYSHSHSHSRSHGADHHHHHHFHPNHHNSRRYNVRLRKDHDL